MHRILIFAIFFLSIQWASFGQGIAPNGHFVKDSVLIGEPTAFVLSIKYPKNLEIVFPDSLHDYFPFELTSKTYFPTKSDSTFSVDSAIYYLSTFEIDSVQYLKMPVYQINEFDSNIFWTRIDSVVLNQVVASIPDSVAMVVNTNYIEVPMAFNYPYAIIGIIMLLIIGLLLWFSFGKKIKRKLLLYRLKKKNKSFIDLFENLVETEFLNSETIVSLWKSYLENLKKEPYTKLTTKEIVNLIKQLNVENALMAIDRNIYGPKDQSILSDAYTVIKEVAILEYTTKVNQITNG